MIITFSNKLTKLTAQDKVRYESATMDFITDHFYNKDWKRYMMANEWTIRYADTSESNPAFFTSLTDKPLNPGVPHGMTNAANKTVDVFINNMSGDRPFMQGMSAASHEFCHMLLFIFYGSKRMKLRLPDKNMRAGSDVAFASGEVHNRLSEGRLRTFKFGGRKILFWFFGGIPMKVIDIKDLTDERLVDRPQ